MEDKLLACYEAIAAASGRMLKAAHAADWDRLVDAETACKALINEARDLRSQCKVSARGEARRLSALRQVMSDDAEIRALMQPWLTGLDRVLAGKPGTAQSGETAG